VDILKCVVDDSGDAIKILDQHYLVYMILELYQRGGNSPKTGTRGTRTRARTYSRRLLNVDASRF
jgi:hypothetical protein